MEFVCGKEVARENVDEWHRLNRFRAWCGRPEHHTGPCLMSPLDDDADLVYGRRTVNDISPEEMSRRYGPFK